MEADADQCVGLIGQFVERWIMREIFLALSKLGKHWGKARVTTNPIDKFLGVFDEARNETLRNLCVFIMLIIFILRITINSCWISLMLSYVSLQ